MHILQEKFCIGIISSDSNGRNLKHSVGCSVKGEQTGGVTEGICHTHRKVQMLSQTDLDDANFMILYEVKIKG